MLAVLAMVAVITIGRQHSRSAAAGSAAPWVVPPPEAPPAPIPLLSDPPSPTAAATGDPRPVARHSSLGRPPSSPSGRPSSRPPGRLLPAPGNRLSLLATGTGLRLRHQSFRMRLSPVGSRSPAPARADATFTLRRGLADAQCVSLESVNFPGRFMRHRNFAVLLQPLEPAPQFAADATFCPERVGPQVEFRLRSVNFPDRYLTADGPSLRLSGPAGSAQSFHAGPGL